MSMQLLPIGSVVALAIEGSPACMVIGFYPTINDESHDYLGVPVPTGLLQGEGAVSFDRELIEEVLYVASSTEEEATLVQEYGELMTEREELIRAARAEVAAQKEQIDA